MHWKDIALVVVAALPFAALVLAAARRRKQQPQQPPGRQAALGEAMRAAGRGERRVVTYDDEGVAHLHDGEDLSQVDGDVSVRFAEGDVSPQSAPQRDQSEADRLLQRHTTVGRDPMSPALAGLLIAAEARRRADRDLEIDRLIREEVLADPQLKAALRGMDADAVDAVVADQVATIKRMFDERAISIGEGAARSDAASEAAFDRAFGLAFVWDRPRDAEGTQSQPHTS